MWNGGPTDAPRCLLRCDSHWCPVPWPQHLWWLRFLIAARPPGVAGPGDPLPPRCDAVHPVGGRWVPETHGGHVPVVAGAHHVYGAHGVLRVARPPPVFFWR